MWITMDKMVTTIYDKNDFFQVLMVKRKNSDYLSLVNN